MERLCHSRFYRLGEKTLPDPSATGLASGQGPPRSIAALAPETGSELAVHLTALGYRIWFDEFALSLGDSRRRSFDSRLASCRPG